MGDLTQPLLKSLSEPGRSRLERVRIVRLEDDLDVGTVGAEAWIGAYTHLGMDLYRLGENGDDPALCRPVAAAPRRDRGARTQLVLDGLVHRLHLGRETRQHVDVLEDKSGRAAEGVGERPAARRKHRPARR